MDYSTFRRGSVVERFEYIFVLFMVYWTGGASPKKWAEEAVQQVMAWTADWM